MVENRRCLNLEQELGCDGCPRIDVKWIWGGDKGYGDAISKQVLCSETGVELVEGVNFSESKLASPSRIRRYFVFK
jgi:hypothetical protein